MTKEEFFETNGRVFTLNVPDLYLVRVLSSDTAFIGTTKVDWNGVGNSHARDFISSKTGIREYCLYLWCMPQRRFIDVEPIDGSDWSFRIADRTRRDDGDTVYYITGEVISPGVVVKLADKATPTVIDSSRLKDGETLISISFQAREGTTLSKRDTESLKNELKVLNCSWIRTDRLWTLTFEPMKPSEVKASKFLELYNIAKRYNLLSWDVRSSIQPMLVSVFVKNSNLNALMENASNHKALRGLMKICARHTISSDYIDEECYGKLSRTALPTFDALWELGVPKLATEGTIRERLLEECTKIISTEVDIFTEGEHFLEVSFRIFKPSFSANRIVFCAHNALQCVEIFNNATNLDDVLLRLALR